MALLGAFYSQTCRLCVDFYFVVDYTGMCAPEARRCHGSVHSLNANLLRFPAVPPTKIYAPQHTIPLVWYLSRLVDGKHPTQEISLRPASSKCCSGTVIHTSTHDESMLIWLVLDLSLSLHPPISLGCLPPSPPRRFA